MSNHKAMERDNVYLYQAEGYWDEDNQLTVTIGDDGGLIIAVSQEQPVDSYVHVYENYIGLPPEIAQALKSFLIAKLISPH